MSKMEINVQKITRIDGFLHGMFLSVCIDSLMQDAIGKEEYLKKVSEQWIDSSITIPLAIGGIIIIISHLAYKSIKAVKDE